jgi:hypothetical protein
VDFCNFSTQDVDPPVADWTLVYDTDSLALARLQALAQVRYTPISIIRVRHTAIYDHLSPGGRVRHRQPGPRAPPGPRPGATHAYMLLGVRRTGDSCRLIGPYIIIGTPSFFFNPPLDTGQPPA